MVDYFRTTPIKAKHSEDPIIVGIPKEVVTEALKTAINSIYGKFNYEFGDRFVLCVLFLQLLKNNFTFKFLTENIVSRTEYNIINMHNAL